MDIHAQDDSLTRHIQTRRLVLRPLQSADAPAIQQGLSLWDVTQWLTVVPFPYTLKDAQDFIRDCLENPQHRHWAIDAGEGLIGLISIKPDMGYWLDFNYHGQGIMSEAAEAIVADHFAQADIDLVSGYHAGNVASARVLEKLGFENAHIETQIQVATQEPVEIQRMILTTSNWKNR